MNLEQQNMRVLAWPTDSANPYTPRLYSHMREGVTVEDFSARKLLAKYSVWHVHWPESLLNIRNPLLAASKVEAFFCALDYLQARNTKIVWTMHNYGSHEKLHPSLEAWFWRQFIPRVDGAISLSAAGLSVGRTRFPRLQCIPTAVIPHGHYRDEYPQKTVEARKMLGIPATAKVLLFFGTIRAYKNVDFLVRIFRKVDAADAILYIVGQPNSSSLASDIRQEASRDPRVRLLFEFVKPEDVSVHLGAADVVVLPFREILNSGSALLALSLNRPILVPDLGAMGELKADFGDRWVRTFAGELSETILNGALDWAAEKRPPVCPMPEKYEWQSIGRETSRFYSRVVSPISAQ
jgi:beta-1,4-mannosyltransferase